MPGKYMKRIVAFVDILGFAQLIESASDNRAASNLINELEAALAKEVSEAWTDTEDFSIRMFSDCICASAPADYAGFIMTIAKLANVQKAMMKHGRLLRGAIACGRHYESSSLIFSETLIRAYNLERHVAIYPRIIVDAPLVSRFLKPISHEKSREVMSNILLLRDADDQIFVNYHNLVNDDEINDRREKNLKQERNVINEGRAAHQNDPSILGKLAWLERYHNYICKFGAQSRRDLGGISLLAVLTTLAFSCLSRSNGHDDGRVAHAAPYMLVGLQQKRINNSSYADATRAAPTARLLRSQTPAFIRHTRVASRVPIRADYSLGAGMSRGHPGPGRESDVLRQVERDRQEGASCVVWV